MRKVRKRVAHVALTVYVEYDLNGESVDGMAQVLTDAVDHMASNGMLSAGTDAEVEKWSAGVAVLFHGWGEAEEIEGEE